MKKVLTLLNDERRVEKNEDKIEVVHHKTYDREVKFEDLVKSCTSDQVEEYHFDFQYTVEYLRDWRHKYDKQDNHEFYEHHAVIRDYSNIFRVHVDWRQFVRYYTPGCLSKSEIYRQCRQVARESEAYFAHVHNYGLYYVTLTVPEVGIDDDSGYEVDYTDVDDTKLTLCHEVANQLEEFGFVVKNRTPISSQRSEYEPRMRFAYNMGFSDLRTYDEWLKTKNPIPVI